MFIPFLPLILASLSLGFIPDYSLNPGRSNMVSVGLMIPAFLLFCCLFAQVKVPLTFRILRNLPVHRVLVFLVWVLSVSWIGALAQLQSSLSWVPIGIELSFFILLATYWLGDALVQDPFETTTKGALQKKSNKTAMRLRLQLPILALISSQGLLIFLLEQLILGLSPQIQTLIVLPLNLLLMVLLSPYLMVVCWKVQPVIDMGIRSMIESELTSSGVSVRKVLLWPDHIMPMATAGVIGFVPGFRYLFISKQLIKNLSSEELRAVIAHEAGHLKRHHLIFFLCGFIAFLASLSLLSYLLSELQWFYVWNFSLDPVIALSTIGGFILFFRVILGFLSRNFERQADCNAWEHLGFLPMRQALLKVAWLNNIDPQSDNWHHYGIQERINFLANCTSSPEMVTIHHQRALKIKIFSLIAVTVLISLNLLITSKPIQLELKSYGIPQQLLQLTSETPLQLQRVSSLSYLANQYLVAEQIQKAEPIYQQLLEVVPENPTILNNYAWLIATHHDDKPEMLEKALNMTQQAIELEDASFIQDTLAEVYFKLGMGQKAVEAATRALELSKTEQRQTSECDQACFEERLVFFHKQTQ